MTPARAAPGAAKLLPALEVTLAGPELVTWDPDGLAEDAQDAEVTVPLE
jgi:hypothetical protein